MRNQQVPEWLDNLITSESKEISKLAQDNSEKINELEKKIDTAETPEELDAIEKELDALESEETIADDSDDADAAVINTEDDSVDEEVPADADTSDVLKEVQEVKKEVTDEKENMGFLGGFGVVLSGTYGR